MNGTLKALGNSTVGNIFIFLCIAYIFIFVFILIFSVLRKIGSGFSREQWGKEIQPRFNTMFFFGCKFFLSGFFGIFIIGARLSASFPFIDHTICGLIGTSIAGFLVWLLHHWFSTLRIMSVAMLAVMIVMLAQEYGSNSMKSFGNETAILDEALPSSTAEAQRSSTAEAQPSSHGGTVGILADSGVFAKISQKDEAVKAGSLYNICPLYDQTKAVKKGATIPIKLQLCSSRGADVSASSIVVTATALTQVSNNSPGVLEDAGNARPDSNFRYDATLGSTGGYIYNLKTTSLSSGTYSLSFTAGSDPTVYSVQFQVK